MDPPSPQLSGALGQRLICQLEQVLATCTEFNIQNAQVVGSVARGEEHPNSDVDLIVDVPATMGLFGLLTFQSRLEDILGTKVDVIPNEGIKSAVRSEMAKDAVSLDDLKTTLSQYNTGAA